MDTEQYKKTICKIISDSSYYENLQSDAQKGARTKYNRLHNWNNKAKSLDQKLVRTMKSKDDNYLITYESTHKIRSKAMIRNKYNLRKTKFPVTSK